MSLSRTDLLRWQFDMAWSLFEMHLDELRDEDFLTEPTEHCWTMRQAPDGRWFPDWEDVEPDPIPVPTIGWLTWHIGWWWTATLDDVTGSGPADRNGVAWPGPGAPAIAWLRDLREQWIATLDGLTDELLDAPASFPWQDDPDKTVAHTVAWVNAELMKNVAEIGQLRRL